MRKFSLYIVCLFWLCQFVKAENEGSFECYVCNKDPHEDDSQACIERVESCAPNVTSCSSVAFRAPDGKMRTRKFCTSPGIPIYQYLMLFPGSAMCQNIETASIAEPPPESFTVQGEDGKPVVALPPAPPPPQTSTLLCVCTKPKCNKGEYRDVLERTMLRNFDINPSVEAAKKKKADKKAKAAAEAEIPQEVAPARFF